MMNIRNQQHRFSSAQHRCYAGFTLIEILIVVVILGILAAIVIPRYVSVEGQVAESSARKQLQSLRSQIELYRFQESTEPGSFNDLLNSPSGKQYIATEPSDTGQYTFVFQEGPPANVIARDTSDNSDMPW